MQRRNSSTSRRLRFEQLESREMFSLQSALTTALTGLDVAAGDELWIQPVVPPNPTAPWPVVPVPQPPLSSRDEPLRLAIHGDGFFIVDGPDGSNLYTRNPDFRINAQHELVTADGRRVLGYRVGSNLELDSSRLASLVVPFGLQGARATRNVAFSGVLSPTAPVGAATMTNFIVYDESGAPLHVSIRAEMAEKNAGNRVYRWKATTASDAAGNYVAVIGGGDLVFGNTGIIIAGDVGKLVIDRQNGEAPRLEIALDFSSVSGLAVANNLGQAVSRLNLQRQDGFPRGILDRYTITATGEVRGFYDNGMWQLLGQIQIASFPDPYGLDQRGDGYYAATPQAGQRSIGSPNTGSLGEAIYHPSSSDVPLVWPQVGARYPWEMRTVRLAVDGHGFFVVQDSSGNKFYTRDGNFHLNIAQQLVTAAGLRLLGYDANDDFQIDSHRLTAIDIPIGMPTASATRNVLFAGYLAPTTEVGYAPAIIESEPFVDPTGAPISQKTRLVDVIRSAGPTAVRLFEVGTLTFTGKRGDRMLAPKQLAITPSTTVGDFVRFMKQAFGINRSVAGDGFLAAGGSVVDGRIRIVSHLGIENRLRVGLSSFVLQTTNSTTLRAIDLPFTTVQQANGAGTTTEFFAFDPLGAPVQVALTTVLTFKSQNSRTFRWFAYSADNMAEPPSVSTALGSGQIVYDNTVGIVSGGTATIAVSRQIDGATQSFAFNLDFRDVIGKYVSNNLGEATSAVSMTLQDGYPVGWLERFIVDDSGLIRGVFDNGISPPLGQIVLAGFRAAQNLRYVGDGLYEATPKSGLPRFGLPGENGLGALSDSNSASVGDDTARQHLPQFPDTWSIPWRLPNDKAPVRAPAFWQEMVAVAPLTNELLLVQQYQAAFTLAAAFESDSARPNVDAVGASGTATVLQVTSSFSDSKTLSLASRTASDA